MSYVSGSGDFTGKQVPKALPASAFGSAASPIAKEVQAFGSSEIIILAGSGSYHFAQATASAGTIIDDAIDFQNLGFSMVSTIDYTAASGSVGAGPPLRLPINANVWSGSGLGAVNGNVIFVKKGGL
jgi:hypothetical protein